jgi:hypothetical protein
MKAHFLALFLFISSFSTVFAQSWDEIASTTARQTWWYFSYRLVNPLPEQHHFRVYLEEKGAWLKDISQLPNGKYRGIADTLMLQGKADTLEFDSSEIDDWMLMTNKILVGGFLIRAQGISKWEKAQSALRFKMITAAVSEDFIRESNLFKNDSGNADIHYADSLLKARFKGGTKGFYGSIQNNIRYPDFARKTAIEGYTSISFVLNGDGSISEYKILRGIGGGTHEEVTRVFEMLFSNWKAAPNGADAVWLRLPFAFRLQ